MHLISSKPGSDWLENAISTGVTIQVPQPQIKERKAHEYNEFNYTTEARVMQLYYKSMPLTNIASYLNIPFYQVLETINK